MTDHTCLVCGHLDGDHGDGYCTKASGGRCPCIKYFPKATPKTHKQESPMTDHCAASEAALHDLMTGEGSSDHYRATAAITEALLAIADAIRQLAPNTPWVATGSPLSDEQPEPGQVDGGETARHIETESCRECGHSYMGGITLTSTDHQNLLARAEKAEAERDAILEHINGLAGDAVQAGGNVPPRMLYDILDRHTTEG